MKCRGVIVVLAILWTMLPRSLCAFDDSDARSLSALGDKAFLERNWYAASEYYREALHLNPAYLEALSGLARSSYELGEYPLALIQVRDARKRAPRRADLAALEAFIHIALGNTKSAEEIIADILLREPWNRDALFARAELGLLAGRPSQASQLYSDIISRYPDDKRALVSLAILSHSMGNSTASRSLVVKALRLHPDDERVYYYAAWLDAQEGQLDRAISSLEQALRLAPDYHEGRRLLAKLLYRTQQYSSCIEHSDILLKDKRDDVLSWYLKARSLEALKRHGEARSLYANALHHDSEDEFSRFALNEALLEHTPLESNERIAMGHWFFDRAEQYRSQFQVEMALASYQLGLRVHPYAKERARYADLLAQSGFPGRQLEELKFMQDIGLADTSINDTVEAWESIMIDSLHRQWGLDPLSVPSTSWKLAVCIDKQKEHTLHVDASLLVSQLLGALLEQEAHLSLVTVEAAQPSFAGAWRHAREAGADYLIMLDTVESVSDFSLDALVYNASSGSLLHTERVYQTGMNKVWNGSFRMSRRLAGLFPVHSTIVARRGNQVLAGFGSRYPAKDDTRLIVVKDTTLRPPLNGFTLAPAQSEIIASLVPEEQDEYVTRAKIVRNGFFDRLDVGDQVLFYAEGEETKADTSGAERPPLPVEIRDIIRTIR